MLYRKGRFVILLFLVFITNVAVCQFAYRIEADILTKTRLPDSTFQISKGALHYDKNEKQIIFDFTFPEKEKVVLFDTIMYTFVEDSLKNVRSNFLIPEQSFFHFILSGNLNNYGFDEARFTAQGIDKKKDMVITTWVPPDHIKPILSKILVATKQKRLYSLTLFDGDGEVLNRQILKSYQLIDGVDIPHEVLIATYVENGVMYQVINLNNVLINDEQNNQKYKVKL